MVRTTAKVMISVMVYKDSLLSVFHTRNSWCSAIFLSLIVVKVSASSMYAFVFALIGSPTIITPCLDEHIETLEEC